MRVVQRLRLSSSTCISAPRKCRVVADRGAARQQALRRPSAVAPGARVGGCVEDAAFGGAHAALELVAGVMQVTTRRLKRGVSEPGTPAGHNTFMPDNVPYVNGHV